MRKKFIRSIKILFILIVTLLILQIYTIMNKENNIEVNGQYGTLTFSIDNYEVVNLDSNNIYDFQISNNNDIIMSGVITDNKTCQTTYNELIQSISKDNVKRIYNKDSEYNIVTDDSNMSMIMIFGKSNDTNGFIAYGLSSEAQIEEMLNNLIIN